MFIFLLLADFYARVLRGPNLRPSPVRGMCYPSPPPFPPQKGKTGGLARSRGFRARTWIPRGRRQANPQLCSRGTLSVNGIFLELSRSSGKRTQQHVYTAPSAVIYGCASNREIKRATFLAFYRSSTMAARACPEFSPRIVSPRQVSGIEDRASLPFRSNYYPFYIYIYISHIFLRVLS